jgi:hypothetical protein
MTSPTGVRPRVVTEAKEKALRQLGVWEAVLAGDREAVRRGLMEGPSGPAMWLAACGWWPPGLEWVGEVVRERWLAEKDAERRLGPVAACVAYPSGSKLARLRASDEFSRMGLRQLERLVPEASRRELEARLDEAGGPRDLAKACRWLLRGLTPELAARKVLLGIHIGLRGGGQG